MLANATRICEANLGVFHLHEAGAFPVVAMQGATPAFVERHRREPLFRPKPKHPLGRLAAAKAVVHIADTLAEPASMRGRLNELTGARTIAGRRRGSVRERASRDDRREALARGVRESFKCPCVRTREARRCHCGPVEALDPPPPPAGG
jgi:hypothetical protein